MNSLRQLYLLGKGSLGLVRERGLPALGKEAGLRLRNRLVQGVPLTDPPELQAVNAGYDRWRTLNTPSKSDLTAMRSRSEQFDWKPTISVIMPVFDVDERWLRRAIDSVLGQAYPFWELRLVDDGSTRRHVGAVLEECARQDSRVQSARLDKNSGISAASNLAIRMSSGEFVVFLDHDDELAPDALFEIARTLNATPSLDIIYTDEDKLDARRGLTTNPYFKPGWSPDLLLAMNYVTHLFACRRTLLEGLGGFRVGTEPGQDYDLVLRLSEKTEKIEHIPKVLYHWRSIPGSTASSGYAKPRAHEAAKRALGDALTRRGVVAEVSTAGAGRFRIRYPILGQPLISLISMGSAFPSTSRRNKGSRLNDYPAIEVVGAGRSDDWGTSANAALSKARGEYILFLGEDVLSGEPGWVEALLEQCQRKEVGVVGARIIGSDNKVCEAGLVATTDPASMFGFRGLHATSRGYFGHGVACRNCSAVSGSCMMARRSLFEELGEFGLGLPSPFAELDFCLRAEEAGYRVIYSPYATVRRSTSSHDIPETSPEAAEIIRRRWGGRLDGGDPYLSPNLRMEHGAVVLNLDAAPLTHGRR